MSFVSEVTTYKATQGKEAAATAAAQSEAKGDAEPFNLGLPVGASPVETPTTTAAAETTDAVTEPAAQAATEKAPATEKKAPIKIGSQEFESIEDAVEYARQLEQARKEDQAYIEGMKDAQTKPQTAEETEAVKSAYEEFAEQVFEDPVKAAREFGEKIKAELREEYNKSLKLQAEAKAVAEAKAAAWDSFYKTNTDLSSPETRDLLENYLLPKWTKEKALMPTDSTEKLAELARKHLRITKEASLPTKALSTESVVLPGATGEPIQAKSTEKSDAAVDFVTALNRLRRKA